MRVVTADPPDYADAAHLLFQHLPAAAAAVRVRHTLRLLEDQSEPAARLMVVRDNNEAVIGTVLAQVLPGATGVLWPPCAAARTDSKHRIEDALLQEALTWLRRGGARLAQAILADEDVRLGDALLRGGFTRPTDLIYLHREAAPGATRDEDFETYREAAPAVFLDTLARTYAGSLDFPEVDGRRSLREVLHGYQVAGHDPDRWWLRRHRGAPVGVLILSVQPGRTWDMTYVGVIPEARKQGHGRALVRKALAEAHAGGADLLTVSVDARNTPALDLYRSAGFSEHDRRGVFLIPLDN